jgi:ferredoxin
MPTTEVYYFSGTGNSLSVARGLAERLGGELVPIASVVNREEIPSEADVIGITFPVYYANLPNIVRRFARKLSAPASSYIFGVVTYGGASAGALDRLEQILAGRRISLDAGFGIHMPQNAFRKFWENRPRAYRRAKRRVSDIAQAVESRRTGTDYTNRLLQAAVSPFQHSFERSSIRYLEKASKTPSPSGLSFEELIPLVDRSYWVTSACNGCGVCATVCPVSNIEIVDGRPVWRHRCENCLACFNWCPSDAIRGGVAKNDYRYRHPEATLPDIAGRGAGPKRAPR